MNPYDFLHLFDFKILVFFVTIFVPIVLVYPVSIIAKKIVRIIILFVVYLTHFVSLNEYFMKSDNSTKSMIDGLFILLSTGIIMLTMAGGYDILSFIQSDIRDTNQSMYNHTKIICFHEFSWMKNVNINIDNANINKDEKQYAYSFRYCENDVN